MLAPGLVSAQFTADFREDIESAITIQNAHAAKLSSSYMEKDILMQAVDVQDITAKLGGSILNVPKMIFDAAKLMPSLLDDFQWKNSYVALDYMHLILYKIGPETRKVKTGSGQDKQWLLRSHDPITDDKLEMISRSSTPDIAKYITETVSVIKKRTNKNGSHLVTSTFQVSTFKNSTPPSGQPVIENDVMLLTIKQASILALYILCKYTDLVYGNNIIILTPLGGAIFPREAVAKLAREPAVIKEGIKANQIIKIINCSAQNGGQFLPDSRADVAAVCVMVGTQGITDVNARKQICHKTYKQFLVQNRPSNKGVFMAFAKYATGGVPLEWTFEYLQEDMVKAKSSLMDLIKAESMAELISVAQTAADPQEGSSSSKN